VNAKVPSLMKQSVGMLARYNAWANKRLYEAAFGLTGDELTRDMGAFFGSLMATLNHLLVGDTIWMCRFQGKKDEIRDLNAVLHDDLSALWKARKELDQQIIDYVESLDEAQLSATVTYRTTRSPTEIEQHLAPLIVHFFNHQTHHRGQAHCIVTALSSEAPSLDLFVYQRETGESIVRGSGNVSLAPEKREAKSLARAG
jgi:uncharacterized damage-inducible protein DinB